MMKLQKFIVKKKEAYLKQMTTLAEENVTEYKRRTDIVTREVKRIRLINVKAVKST